MSPNETYHGMVVAMFLAGRASAEIARSLRMDESTVSGHLDRAFRKGEITSDLVTYAAHPSCKPINYDNHDDYSRHFAGAEFEDTRDDEQRERDFKHPYRYRGIYGRNWPG